MDLFFLELINQVAIHPILDILMIGATTFGFALLPLLGFLLIWRGRRDVGYAILFSLGVGFVFTILFYYLAMRPRPIDVRLLLPTPPFPSFPSGHAVAAFATGTVMLLSYRRRWLWLGPLGACLISYSRMYLGHHYPSDILGGIIFGISIGAMGYGLFVAKKSTLLRIRWLLWPQVAIAVVMTQIAYLGFLPLYLLQWPFSDKVLHFLAFGAIVFWLNVWLNRRKVQVAGFSLPLAIVIPLTFAIVEEFMQYFSPIRTLDWSDLTSDLLGMLWFWWLSEWLLKRNEKNLNDQGYKFAELN